jgi:tripartite ATP-independent transporter DctM subunit
MDILTNVPATIILVGLFLALMFLRLPIVFAIGISSVVTTIYLDLPLMMVAQNMIKGINVFVLLTVPFFILVGEIMSTGGIADRLINLASSIVGWMRGGLAMVNIVASMFLGGITGSSAADASAIGSLMIPVMKKKGYDTDYATVVTMSASVQGILVPPSHNIILYSLAAGGVSIGGLFLAGIIPGFFLMIALMIFSYILARIRNYPVGQPFNLKTFFKCFKSSILALITVFIVVIGVITGVFTATESAAIAVAYSMLVTFVVYRQIPMKEMWGIIRRSMKVLSIVMLLIGTSGAFGWLLAYLKVPMLVSSGILSFSHNPVVVLLIINGILLFLGCLMEMSAIILIATPILLPIAKFIGIDPIHFGIIMMLNLGIGLLTPPVGSTLFIGSAISGLSIEKLSKSMLPFLAVMLVVLVFLTYVPVISMFLPRLFNY